jgi:hypothetical protein
MQNFFGLCVYRAGRQARSRSIKIEKSKFAKIENRQNEKIQIRKPRNLKILQSVRQREGFENSASRTMQMIALNLRAFLKPTTEASSLRACGLPWCIKAIHSSP